MSLQLSQEFSIGNCQGGCDLVKTNDLPDNYFTTDRIRLAWGKGCISEGKCISFGSTRGGQYEIGVSKNKMFICDNCEARIYTELGVDKFDGPHHCSKCNYDLCNRCYKSLSVGKKPDSILLDKMFGKFENLIPSLCYNVPYIGSVSNSLLSDAMFERSKNYVPLTCNINPGQPVFLPCDSHLGRMYLC